MNHYCTYFDGGFLVPGLALWRSLQAHEPDAVLWVLTLDSVAYDFLSSQNEPGLRPISLAELEAADPQLAAAQRDRTRVEYYFTLSPCWPLWLLKTHPEIDRLTYLDADLFFFANPSPIFTAMDAAGASVLITAHRFPSWLKHYERHGRFNVGVLSFRNDAAGRSCLEAWRAQCLEWCYDRIEGERYADQKYLDHWPAQLGSALLVLEHPGVNMAPWNWAGLNWAVSPAPALGSARLEAGPAAIHPASPVALNGLPLIIFHFARFRGSASAWWWQSGQLDYGVMPWRLRNAIYAPYARALDAALAEIKASRPDYKVRKKTRRGGREFWRSLPLRVLFGGSWLRMGGRFWNLRAGAGRWSGQCLAKLRAIFLRAKRTPESRSQNQQRQPGK